MGGFPSLPSTNNPYADVSARAGSGAVALANALREADTQQQALQARQAQQAQVQQHQSLVDQLDILSKGGVPADTITQDPSGLKVRTPNPAAGTDPSRIVQTDSGRYYIPTPAEKKKADEAQDDTNSFPLSQTTSDAMNEMYGADTFKPGQRLPLAHAAMATEAVKAHLSKNALDDTNSVQVTADASNRLATHGIDIKPGARIPIEHAANAIDLAKLAYPDEKSKPPRTKTDLEHFSSPISVNEDTGDITALKLPPGVKPQPTPGQQEVTQRFNEREEDRADAKSQKQQADAQKLVDQLQQREKAQHEKRSDYSAVIWGDGSVPVDKETGELPDNARVTDPKTNREVKLDAGNRTRFKREYRKATDLAASFNAQAKKIVTRFGGDTGDATNASTKTQTDQPTADAPKAAKTAPASTKPGSPAPAKKVKVWNAQLARFE